MDGVPQGWDLPKRASELQEGQPIVVTMLEADHPYAVDLMPHWMGKSFYITFYALTTVLVGEDELPPALDGVMPYPVVKTIWGTGKIQHPSDDTQRALKGSDAEVNYGFALWMISRLVVQDQEAA